MFKLCKEIWSERRCGRKHSPKCFRCCELCSFAKSASASKKVLLCRDSGLGQSP